MKKAVLTAVASILGALLVLVAVIIFRTVNMTYEIAPQEKVTLEDIPFEAAVSRLSKAIQFQTISHQNHNLIDYNIYEEFIAFLAEEYPLIHEHLELERFGGYSLLYSWPGTDPDLDPVMLIGHYDVVPVEQGSLGAWKYGPFSGEVAEGFIWGRGAIDDKSGIFSYLEATEHLLSTGFQPERSLMIALNHDEEIGGRGGARVIADSLYARGINLNFLMDEGLPLAEEIIAGINSPLALIGVAEKGYVSLELSLSREGGHSSMPPQETVIGTLSQAISDLKSNPMPGRFTGLIQESFEPISPNLPFSYRVALANLWLFRGVVERRLSNIPHTNAAMRTTIAPTIFQAGIKENVLPSHAEAIINFRIHPQDNVITVTEHVRNIINNDEIRVREIEGARNPSFVSETNNRPYHILKQSIREVFEEVPVAPSMFVAASDSRHFHDVTRNIYRFRPIRATPADRSRIHGTNERIGVDNYREMIHFSIQLIKNSTNASGFGEFAMY